MQREFSNAAHTLRAHPAFSAAIVVMVAIALAACAAVFGVLDRLILHPLPFPNAAQLAGLENAWPLFVDGDTATYPDGPFTRIARYSFGRATLTSATPARVVKVAEVSSDYFSLLGLAPSAGRFPATTDEPGVVVISASLRQLLFADDDVALGQSLVLNGRVFKVTAVTPYTFTFYVGGETVEAWIPSVNDKPLIQLNQQIGSGTIARLKPQVTIAAASAAMQGILARIAAKHPELRISTKQRIEVMSLRDQWFGSLLLPLLLLLGAAGSLLAIACANATGLMLARAAARQRDSAIRLALGAGRGDVLREAVAESLMLGGIAALVGVVLAQWGTRALIIVSPVRIPGADEIGISPAMIVFAIVIALPTTAIAGLVAASRAGRFDMLQALNAGGRPGSFVSPRLRRILVGAQVAMTVALLVNTALLVRSFRALRGENTGFDSHNVLTMEIAPAATRFPDAAARLAYYHRLLADIRERQVGAVVAIVNYLPLYSGSLMIPVGTRDRAPKDALSWTYRSASPDYFRAMRIPLLAGRVFTEQDRIGAPYVAMVDRSAARQLAGTAPIDDVIGRQIILNLGEPTSVEIVGVVGDIRQQGLGIASYPGLYVSAYQRPPAVANLVIRTPSAVAPNIVRGAIRDADRDLAVATLHDLESNVTDSVSRRRFAVVVTGILGVSALILAVFGLAALMSQLVTFRSHEIGVRMALGARSWHVLLVVVRQGLAMVVIGIGVGLVGALAGARLLAGLLYGVAVTDPVAYAVVPITMIAVAALACAYPAHRAVRTDPTLSMRGG